MVAVTSVKSVAPAPPSTSAVAQSTVTRFAVAPARVTTKLTASPSLPVPSATEKLGVASLSVIVIVSPLILRSPELPLTRSFSSGSLMLSPFGSRVKEPVALAAWAATVIVNGVTAAKSLPWLAVTPTTLTVTSLASPKRAVPPTVAVTVISVAPSSSPTVSGLTVRVISAGAASSSVIVPMAVSSVIVGVSPGPSAAFAGELNVTSNVSASSWNVSSVVWTVTVFVVSPAAKVRVVASTSVKSVAAAPSSTSAVAQSTVTTLGVAPARVTTKVIASPSLPLPSATEKLGVASSSVIVPVARGLSIAVPALASLSSTRNVSAFSSSVSSVVATENVAVVTPSANVSVCLAVTAV